MRRNKKGRAPGFFTKYGAAAAFILAALLLFSASAVLFTQFSAMQEEASQITASDLDSLRDAVAFGARTRLEDVRDALSAAAGYAAEEKMEPDGSEIAPFGTDALTFTYESPDVLTGLSEYLGESRSRLEEKLAAGDLVGILIHYPGSDWEYTLFTARGVSRGRSLAGVVCGISDAARLFPPAADGLTDTVLLVTQEGLVVPASRTQHIWTEENGYNLLSRLPENAAGTLKTALADAKTGSTVTKDGSLSFAPLGVNGWSVVVLADSAETANTAGVRPHILTYAALAAGLLAVVLVLLAVLFYREAARTRRLRSERFAALSEFTDRVYFEYDLTRREAVFTPNVRRVIPSLTGTVLSLRKKKRSFRHVHPEDTESLHSAIRHAAEAPIDDLRLRIRVRSGQYEPFVLRTKLLSGGGRRTLAVMGELVSLSGQESLDASLTNPANRDELTGMPNYNGVRLRTERLIAENQNGALLVVDLNNFSAVNEQYGKEAGDELLRRISRTVAKNFRRDDIVGRTGGDEFTIYMVGAEEYGIVARKAEALLEKIEELAKNLHVTASIGIAFSPYDGATYEALSQAANTAMSMVKKENAAAYRFFSSGDLQPPAGGTPSGTGF